MVTIHNMHIAVAIPKYAYVFSRWSIKSGLEVSCFSRSTGIEWKEEPTPNESVSHPICSLFFDHIHHFDDENHVEDVANKRV